jgi:hypothetical protein
MAARGHHASIDPSTLRCCPPVIYLLVEDAQKGDLDIDRDGHVILDSVQRPKNQVEDADGVAQLDWEALNDHCEAAWQIHGHHVVDIPEVKAAAHCVAELGTLWRLERQESRQDLLETLFSTS